MSLEKILVPDIGDYESADVMEIEVKVGDVVNVDDSLMTIETDKASMEIPSNLTGTITNISVNVGDKVSEGDFIFEIETENLNNIIKESVKDVLIDDVKEIELEIKAETEKKNLLTIVLPDIGDYESADIIEILVAIGDDVKKNQDIITIETDKASMEIPIEFAGTVSDIKIKVGDSISKGDDILELLISKNDSVIENNNTVVDKKNDKEILIEEKIIPVLENSAIYASPGVRRLAHILGAKLESINPTGEKGRITKDDCEKYIKNAVTSFQSNRTTVNNSLGFELLADPKVDFTKFGETEILALTKINKLTANNLTRNAIKIPHVTFFDDADTTELEIFRKSCRSLAEKKGLRLSSLVFLIKIAGNLLEKYPRFNSSLSADGENLILKKYFNIGFAVDTPKGLIVPVIKNVNNKSIFQIADEFMDLVNKGREGKIKPTDMQGACFTISSLGSLGTTGFTPIINMPEVAILGVSKTITKPVWNGKAFDAKQMLPLSLSVDHRVIDGALAAKFLTSFCSSVADIREILL